MRRLGEGKREESPGMLSRSYLWPELQAGIDGAYAAKVKRAALLL